MDAHHLRIDALLLPYPAFRTDLRMRSRTSTADGWEELQRERTPEPGRLKVFARRGWNQVVGTGRARVEAWIRGEHAKEDGPVEHEGWLLPIWRADNDVDEPASDVWGPAAALLGDDDARDDLFIDEMLPGAWTEGLPAAFRIRWMEQAVLRVEEEGARPAMQAAGGYALVRWPVRTLVAVLDVRSVASGSPPSGVVPGFSEHLEPVALPDLGIRDVRARLAALQRP